MDLCCTCAGLLCIGKIDFEAAQPVSFDPFFQHDLVIKQ